ncbi:hypothetical protein CC1G_01130 [Coprinopsis cinerea okayama7|uniref:SNF7 family protein n=1 Tax=Coprinopsis cinerea (strain Okayama-7 / 130 / ATCC MYA-4618 / FGSC 9003) TaxID=240176 RepID=A8NEL8_COPC7|nr:hypothetical protein CC1G_01130 [Coprinopsis cinerea okayama7\|eukprot:XP_001833068.2 hypothetical protein CC1G_01130 [Coprinopsis cinerea okayama7\
MASTPSTPSSSSQVLSFPPFNSTSTSRLQSLYSDLSRKKHSDPASFQADVVWWKKALETIVSTGLQDGDESTSNSSKRLILQANASLMDLVKVPKVGKPLALGSVLAELHASNTFIPITDFINMKASLYATSSLPVRIASYVIGRPLWWALETAGIVGDEGILGSSMRERNRGTAWYGEYVLVPLVEKAGNAIIQMQEEAGAGPADALYSWSGFSKTFASAIEGGSQDQLHKDDVKVLLKFLERDRGVLVYDKNVIKFVDPSGPSEERTITAVDRGVLELKNAVESVRTQIDALQRKMDRCTRDASAALRQDRKAIALNHIRLRKQLQELLTKRLSSLSTLESTLLTVEASMGDIEIMNSYEASTATLKSILTHPSLQRENIDKTLEALAEANADAREVNEAVQIGGDVAVGAATDDDVEEEYEALLREMETIEIDEKFLESRRRLQESEAPQHRPVSQQQGKQERTPVLAA